MWLGALPLACFAFWKNKPQAIFLFISHKLDLENPKKWRKISILDIDGLDPSAAPGTGTPEHGGLTSRDCLEFMRLIVVGLPVKVMDVAEVSPPLDNADVTSLGALKVIYEVFGFVQAKSTQG